MNNFVALSGGVDSTALALLMPEAELIFTDTCWEFPELYRQLEKISAKTNRQITKLVNQKYPKGLPDYILERKFFPNHKARYCTRKFKIEVMNQYLKNYLPANLCVALRADEPQRVGNLTQIDGLTISYPLREAGLNRIDTLRICMENDLLPRYPVYMARGGCKGCFYKRKSEVLAMNSLIPTALDDLQDLEESVQDERGKQFYMFSNCEMSIRELRSQPILFDQTAVYRDASDKSDYGPNCGLFCNR